MADMNSLALSPNINRSNESTAAMEAVQNVMASSENQTVGMIGNSVVNLSRFCSALVHNLTPVY